MINILAFWDGWLDSAKDKAGQVIIELFYSICYAIDYVVYSFIPRLYSLIVSLANVDLYTGNQAISALMNRMYILVGVFMLFKLAFSIVRYIIDPNAFSDQSKGFTSLVKSVLIVLVLLVLTPWMFGKLYEVQGIILNNNIISNLILGTDNDENSDLSSAAREIQFLIFSPFFSINPVGELVSCAPTSEKPLANILGTTDMATADISEATTEGGCLDSFAKAMDADQSVQASGVTIDQFFKNENEDNRSFGAFGGLLFMKINDGTDNAINYLPIASALCGGYFVFLLLSFCIDIAGRAIKLMFLQILSPIAIIASIDPTSSSQNDRLKEWGKECLTTFLSLFLRLAVIYLVIQMVKVITSQLFSSSLYYEDFNGNVSASMNILVYVFLVLGAFQVAKKIPELLEKALGIKMSGELSLNPFKNSAVAGMAGLGVGVAAGGMAGAVAGTEAGAPMRGLLGGMATGGMKGIGTKPSLGMFSDLRRKTYKDMSGNDMKTFNPLQKIYGMGGSKKVDAEKGYRNKAYGQLNELDTQLGMISHRNAQNYSWLTSKGFDLNRKDEDINKDIAARKEKISSYREEIKQNQSNLKSAQSTRNTQQNKVSDLKRQLDEVNSQLNNKNRIMKSDGSNSDAALERLKSNLSSEYSSAENSLRDAENQVREIEQAIASKQQSIANESSILNTYEDYKKGVEKEQGLRKDRSEIERDISTINDQISDMKTFYHIDESTKQSVAEAKSHIDKR